MILRAFRRVLSGVGVCADRIAHCPATHRAAGFLIETASISVIGPKSGFPIQDVLKSSEIDGEFRYRD
jgi:hypothetical protein